MTGPAGTGTQAGAAGGGGDQSGGGGAAGVDPGELTLGTPSALPVGPPPSFEADPAAGPSGGDGVSTGEPSVDESSGLPPPTVAPVSGVDVESLVEGSGSPGAGGL